MRKGLEGNTLYEIDLGGAPPMDPLVPMLEAFDHPSSSSHVNTVGRGGALAKRLLYAKLWLGLKRRLSSLLVDMGSACNPMSLGCCKRLGVVV